MAVEAFEIARHWKKSGHHIAADALARKVVFLWRFNLLPERAEGYERSHHSIFDLAEHLAQHSRMPNWKLGAEMLLEAATAYTDKKMIYPHTAARQTKNNATSGSFNHRMRDIAQDGPIEKNNAPFPSPTQIYGDYKNFKNQVVDGITSLIPALPRFGGVLLTGRRRFQYEQEPV